MSLSGQLRLRAAYAFGRWRSDRRSGLQHAPAHSGLRDQCAPDRRSGHGRQFWARTRRLSRCLRRILRAAMRKIHDYTDMPEITLKQIAHFFEHYKDLEPGKWVQRSATGAMKTMPCKFIVEAIRARQGQVSDCFQSGSCFNRTIGTALSLCFAAFSSIDLNESDRCSNYLF